MATIELDRTFYARHGERRYRVGFEDDDGLTRERYFTSRRAAERYALEIEMRLLNEAGQGFVTVADVIPDNDTGGDHGATDCTH